jgi:1,4-alpha-glucan branching enzyme
MIRRPLIADFDRHLFGEGRHWHIYRLLGAHVVTVDGVAGVRFATWAPNAGGVSVVGDFNGWDGGVHPLHRHDGGVWETFVPGVRPGALYKFELRHRQTGRVVIKTDPYGRRFEHRPATAAIVEPPSTYAWQDADWLRARDAERWLHGPVSIYELHPGSWQRPDGSVPDYRTLAERLVGHVAECGFTHVELLPICEYPLDESWGYQTTGYFAPTSRHGTPDDFRYFVDCCHRHGIGVLLDWTPAHFPRDDHALARFDGEPLYEYADPRVGEHRDWGTLIFDYGRNEVRNFLLASAVFWLEEFHVDGLRVDAVASMLYLDYSRRPGEWRPNLHGGRENLEAVTFLRDLNTVLHGSFPGCMVIAEESTAWPLVTRPVTDGGLGFSMKWNMGWMHDTLNYCKRDPVHRRHHHENLTFGILYAFAENFVLPLSHDEVVHCKGSLLARMPGDDWQRFANLRLLLTWQWTYPGKKLLFMGGEFGQRGEWDFRCALAWGLLDQPPHRGVLHLIADLNRLYKLLPALHRLDFEGRGFEWLECHDAANSAIAYLRRDDAGETVAVVLNFTPVPRPDYRLGVPRPGVYRELLNSDSEYYGGGNLGNRGRLVTEPVPCAGRAQSLRLTLPPLAALILAAESGATGSGTPAAAGGS